MILANGRRFGCRHPVGRALTLSRLRAAGCTTLAPLKLSQAQVSVARRLDNARACLKAHRIRALGGPNLPGSSDQPDGELVVGSTEAAFLAFYLNPAKAQRLRPAIAQHARRLHWPVQTQGAVTVLWTYAGSARLRRQIAACAFG